MKKEIVITKNLKKTYHTKAGSIEVLKGIDFIAYQGEMIAITGASGVGKSTFLHVVGTLDTPSSGEILYKFNGDINPTGLSRDALSEFRNRYIGFVFQFHYLLQEFNVIENLIMPKLIGNEHKRKDLSYEELKEKGFEILKKLGLAGRAYHYPGELSGGEQQRVAVARALFNNPPLVLTDEPTGNLDSKTARELFELLKNINSELGTTFIIVTHNDSLAQQCTRKIKMIDGVLVE